MQKNSISFEAITTDIHATGVALQMWKRMSPHWQTLIIHLPCKITIHPSAAIESFVKEAAGSSIYCMQPHYIHVIKLNESYAIRCADRNCYTVMEGNGGINDYHLMIRILRGIAAALYDKYPWIGTWLKKNAPPNLTETKTKMQSMFVTSFPPFCIDQKFLWSNFSEEAPVMYGLDANIFLHDKES